MLRFIAMLFSVLCLGSAFAETPIPAAPRDWVTDRAGVLSQETKEILTTSLQNYQTKSGHQILVWVDQTTGGVPIEDWAVRAFEAWRVGRAGIDDGIVLFLFVEDRSVRVEVGYGLEGVIPDALASQIIREETLPLAKQGDYNGAVRATVGRLLSALGEESSQNLFHVEQTPLLNKAEKIAAVVSGIVMLLLFLWRPSLFFWILLNVLGSGRSNRGGNGGGFSGRGGRSGGGGASGHW